MLHVIDLYMIEYKEALKVSQTMIKIFSNKLQALRLSNALKEVIIFE